MSNIVDTVEDWIQNAFLTAIDNIVAPKIELAIRSINASSGRDAASVSANSERREHAGVNTSFGNACGNSNTVGVSNVNDETRHNIPDEVSELPVPETHFGRQPYTHHSVEIIFSSLLQREAANFLFIGTESPTLYPTTKRHRKTKNKSSINNVFESHQVF